ncbi:hypothetical protein BKA70DRAFT_122930 [Coprinopsis sp. MPI-PUGE-AT-0042]|nr:hypothetical protein BKA70DRAFT_122930 [Coprinopsis sp. MPI-PUGE-AT-0042]
MPTPTHAETSGETPITPPSTPPLSPLSSPPSGIRVVTSQATTRHNAIVNAMQVVRPEGWLAVLMAPILASLANVLQLLEQCAGLQPRQAALANPQGQPSSSSDGSNQPSPMTSSSTSDPVSPSTPLGYATSASGAPPPITTFWNVHEVHATSTAITTGHTIMFGASAVAVGPTPPAQPASAA